MVRALGGPVRALAVTGTGFLAAGVAVAGAPSLTMLTLAFAALGLFDGFVDTAMNRAGNALRAHAGVSVMGRLHATLAGATLAGTGCGVMVAGTLSVLAHTLAVAVALLAVLVVALRALTSDNAARQGNTPQSVPQAVAPPPRSP